jgi:hypothetical protein
VLEVRFIGDGEMIRPRDTVAAYLYEQQQQQQQQQQQKNENNKKTEKKNCFEKNENKTYTASIYQW